MKRKEEFESLVENLTELEMADLLESCEQVINRNKWNKLRDAIFTDSDVVENLEWENSKLEDKIDELDNEKEDIERDANRALEYLIGGKIDEAKKILSEI